MMKRFFSVNVDEHGNIRNVQDTSNHNVFRNNHLNIYKSSGFFNEHFGKYPVITIDYRSLSKATSFNQFIFLTKQIIFQIVKSHKYFADDSIWSVIKNSNQWINEDEFATYEKSQEKHAMDHSNIKSVLPLLCKCLHKHFKNRVIVLIDNYDAFVESSVFTKCPNISTILGEINCALLQSESVERSVVTGVSRPRTPFVNTDELLPPNVKDSTADPKVWPYFGLSEEELSVLLQQIIVDANERNKIKRQIVEYSKQNDFTSKLRNHETGHMQDTQVCSIWSVMKYFEAYVSFDEDNMGYIDYSE